ncbi:MAG: type II secretion system protein J [Bdellovibrio sp.]
MKNLGQKGFTLMEVLVASGMLVILSLCVGSFLISVSKSTKEVEEDLSISTDVLLLERTLVQDLKASSSSFNNIVTKDDRGLNFFDYITEQQDLTNRGERLLTLLPDKNEFIFIVDSMKTVSMLYAPEKAYNVGPQPTSAIQEASLTFVSLNKDKIVSKRGTGSASLWEIGNILMLDSPASFRRVTTTGLDYTVPARSPVYLGVVTKGDVLGRLSNVGMINFSHPLYPNETISNEDYFLRNIPAVGGGNPLVRLKKVFIVKYYLKTEKDMQISVYRSVHNGSGFPEGSLLAKGIKSLVMKRAAATSSIIDYMVLKK